MLTLPPEIARRSFVLRSGISLGAMAATSLGMGRIAAATETNGGVAASASRGMIQPLHIPPRARRIIWLYMAGGMTHLDTFDHKPKLAELDGQPMPESVTQGQQIAQLQGQSLNCLGPQHAFQRWGQSGQSISDIWPRLAESCADELCIVRSMHTEAINHDPAHTFMNTGTMIPGRPRSAPGCCMAWAPSRRACPALWSWFPPANTARSSRSRAAMAFWILAWTASGRRVSQFRRPGAVRDSACRSISFVAAGSRHRSPETQFPGRPAAARPEIAARISQYELAFRMQSAFRN